jgi:hypothetical protein
MTTSIATAGSGGRRRIDRRRAQAVCAVALTAAMMLGLPPPARAQGPPAPAVHPAPVAAGREVEDRVGASAPNYTVSPHADTNRWSPTGWGLSATALGRSTDLWNWNGVSEDPNARPGELEAGLGWHGRDLSFMAGYARPDFGASAVHLPHSLRPQGLVGLSVELRTH